ncbi:L-methionine/branched-chain amino acid transporter [Endozoicomonas sp. SM1973]|uniref:L-methionine/branched-chain amino acid transporter n=1 Tax=Spartinivicinus marinus TaxID=2994442 RepID=A0A853IFB5_9GAMM|nr:L-methionine/branched-chain amino acid transporter [Spartinivicinus marinus]MCX4027379.1 L-methionine/branched-chain amino acid transporter [Spartinivicinus marinus]NYZ69228.1 L-methionine/branched-chain amino acid transporter [Spartinivicinus marinus]
MNQLNNTITLPQGVGLLVTTMMGTGVFVLPQLTVQDSGSAAMLAWLLLIMAMLPVTWIFAELGKRYPHAGGPSHIVSQAFGETQGKVVGLMFLLLVPVGVPAAIEITMQFVQTLVPLAASEKFVVELVFIFSLLALNWKGVQASGRIQAALTITMIVVVLAVSLKQFSGQTEPALTRINFNQWPLVASAVGLAFWSFMGVETMSHLSAEFKNPERDFGRALILGVIIVGLIYLVCTWSILQAAPGTNTLAMVDVFNQQFGQGGRWVIGILGIFSGAATVNVYLASSARLAYSLANQGALPSYLHRLNQYNVPGNGLMTISVCTTLILAIAEVIRIPFDDLIRWTNGVFVLIYLFTMVAAYKLLPGKFKLIAAFGSIVCLLLGISLGINMTYALALWALLILFYAIARVALQRPRPTAP